MDKGKGGKFSGGFDINVFEKVHKTGMQSLDLIALSEL